MHRDTYVSSSLIENTIWRQMTITLMVINTFFSSSYLLCLFCFFFYWVFTFSWTPKDELVDGEETLKSLVPPEGVRAKLLAKIEKLKASEQSSFPLPGMTIEIPENEPLAHSTPTCSKNLDDSNDISSREERQRFIVNYKLTRV